MKATSNFFHYTDELTLHIPALSHPTLEQLNKLGERPGRDFHIKSIERDTSPTSALTLRLVMLVQPENALIDYNEYERQIAPKHDILLGFQHAQWLVKHQTEFPDLMALQGKIYIEFPGLVVVSDKGGRFIPDISMGNPYHMGWTLLDNISDHFFRGYGRVAASRKGSS